MKIFNLKLFILIVLLYTYSNANVLSIITDNDAFVSKADGRYTGGLFINWLKENNNSKANSTYAISFSNILYTPDDYNSTEPILDKVPYAGYMKFNFLYYKYSNNYFHEFGFNIGAVGPITHDKEIQEAIHRPLGAPIFKGWDTQLDNQLMLGISYNYATKTKPIDIGISKFDWTNNIRVNIGNFYTGALASTSFRFGNHLKNMFITTGNFIGDNESHLLNFKQHQDFSWFISVGFFTNKIYKYYIIDEAIKNGYTLSKLNRVTGNQISYNLFYNNTQYTLSIESIYIHNDNVLTDTQKRWGTISITWRY